VRGAHEEWFGRLLRMDGGRCHLKTDLKGMHLVPVSQVWEKRRAVCAVWEVFALEENPSHAYVFSFPETDFRLGYQKILHVGAQRRVC